MEKVDLGKVRDTLKETPYPVNLVLETCAVCNLRCLMCPYKTMKRKNGYMSKELYEKIIKEIANSSPMDTAIWFAFMGEPLLHNGIFSRIAYAKKMGIEKTCLNTNATMVNDAVSEVLKDSGIDKVFVSVDAYDYRTYNKIKGVDFKFGHIEDKVESLVDAGIDVTVQFIVMDENRDEEQLFKDHWIKKGAKVKIRNKLGWGGKLSEDREIPERNMPCPWLMRQMIVLWDGCVAQCDGDYEGEHIKGNANDSSIYSIWNGELAELRNKHCSGNYDFEPCKTCNDWSVGMAEIYE